jgi:hypothetical protein
MNTSPDEKTARATNADGHESHRNTVDLNNAHNKHVTSKSKPRVSRGGATESLAIDPGVATKLAAPVIAGRNPHPLKPSYKFVEPAQTPALAYLQRFKQ